MFPFVQCVAFLPCARFRTPCTQRPSQDRPKYGRRSKLPRRLASCMEMLVCCNESMSRSRCLRCSRARARSYDRTGHSAIVLHACRNVGFAVFCCFPLLAAGMRHHVVRCFVRWFVRWLVRWLVRWSVGWLVRWLALDRSSIRILSRIDVR